MRAIQEPYRSQPDARQKQHSACWRIRCAEQPANLQSVMPCAQEVDNTHHQGTERPAVLEKVLSKHVYKYSIFQVRTSGIRS